MSRIFDTAQLLTSRRRGVSAAACLAMTALVAGCGGGDRVKPFQPTQIIAFGDENSAFDDTSDSGTPLVQFQGTAIQGARYTINLVRLQPSYCTNDPTSVTPASCTEVSIADILTGGTIFVPAGPGAFNDTILTSAIPLVNEVELGAFYLTPGTPVYRTTDRIYDCSNEFGAGTGNWVQILAQSLGGAGLSLGGGGSTGCIQDAGNGRSYAAWGAKVADVATQVNTNLGALHDGVLVTMLAGQNDIMAAYKAVQIDGTMTADEAQKAMRDQGVELAKVIGTIVNAGARVVYLTVPDMGSAPASAANPALATALTRAFNDGYKGSGENRESGGLVLSVLNDGHKIVKVDGFNPIASMAASGNYALTAACETDLTKAKAPDGRLLTSVFPAINSDPALKAKALLLNCNSSNLVVTTARNTAATPAVDEVRAYYGSYLWADDQHLAPEGHITLANLAASRVSGQL